MRYIAAFLLALLLPPAAQAQDATAKPETKGEYLARAGDCVACHSVADGKPFAGGLKMGSPLGAIYSTNITPGKETGIGLYSLDDFDKALRKGVARDGHRLYPAMPYPSYAKLSDEDVKALYDFFMKEVPAARQANLDPEIPKLLRWRWPLAVWNAMFTDKQGFTADPKHDAPWNRGAYLVQGLGHCGACHTPRGWAFQEKALDDSGTAFLAGANLDGWYAASLRQNLATGLGGWSAAEITEFLKTGHNVHGSAYGSMLDVVNNSTSYLTDEDLAAIGTYLKSLPADKTEPAYAYDASTATMLAGGHPPDPGAALYATTCQSCHRETGGGSPPFVAPLAGNPTVLTKDASSLINIVLNGSQPLVPLGVPEAYRMPQFRAQLTDQQIAEVVTFMRQAWGNKADPVTAKEVAELRKSTDPSSDQVVILRMR